MTTKRSLKTVKEILDESIAYLKEKGVLHPRRCVEEMLASVLSLTRIELYLAFDQPLNPEELERCRSFLRRLSRFEPIQYILGETTFYGCTIKVDQNVLIPRPETEILVDKVVKEIGNGTGKTLLDLCTGSGCIGIAVKKALPELEVICADISPEALSIAKENAEINDVHVQLLQGDLFQPLEDKKCDYIVSNPPYVSSLEYEALSKEVKDFEPKGALVAPEEGLGFYQRIAEEYRKYLTAGGRLWLEIGSSQGEAVNRLFNGRGRVEADWSGHSRFFSLENE